MSSEPVPTQCPECRSPRTAPVSYGLVEEWDEAMERDLSEGRYVLGGDIIFPDASRWACLGCGHRWGSFWSQFDPTALAELFGAKDKPPRLSSRVPARAAQITLAQLGLSPMAVGRLESDGIVTALDLCVRGAEGLLEVRGFGHEQLQEVRTRLVAFDLWLAGEKP